MLQTKNLRVNNVIRFAVCVGKYELSKTISTQHPHEQRDLSKSTDTVSKPWGFADDWQLIMWLMAVGAFYYRLRMSINAASVVERKQYERYRRVMMRHVDFGKQILAFPRVPPELGSKALLKIADFMERSAAILGSGLRQK